MIGLTAMLLLAGVCATLGTVSGNKGTVALILLYCWYYNCTIGATSWVAASEIGTSRLRNKTAGLGLAAQGVLAVSLTALLSRRLTRQCFWNFVLPFMFNPNAGNLQGKVAFIFGATSVFTCIYTYFYHPETKGRSFEEIDEMFFKRIPARKFGTYVTDAETRAAEVKAEDEKLVPGVSFISDERGV
jgi:SP family general alpha glucoside:H+ symporter-like MFS transporter